MCMCRGCISNKDVTIITRPSIWIDTHYTRHTPHMQMVVLLHSLLVGIEESVEADRWEMIGTETNTLCRFLECCKLGQLLTVTPIHDSDM